MKYNILCITPVKHLPGVYEELEKYGKITYLPNISKKKLRIFLRKKIHDCLFLNPNKQGFILDESILKESSIKIINTCSTGTNHIDLTFCKKNNIKVWSLKKNLKLLNKLPSTSELAFGLMIVLLRKILPAHNSVLDYNWNYLPYLGSQIKDLTVGVVGYGRLGKIFCKQLEGFGAKILICDPFIKTKKYENLRLSKLAERVDVLALHVHVNDSTRKFIDGKILSKMKKGAILINTSRGELVDEDAVLKSLRKKHLAGYGTDVIIHEFDNLKKSKLIKYAKKLPILLTPHIGGMTIQGQSEAFLFAVRKFKHSE